MRQGRLAGAPPYVLWCFFYFLGELFSAEERLRRRRKRRDVSILFAHGENSTAMRRRHPIRDDGVWMARGAAGVCREIGEPRPNLGRGQLSAPQGRAGDG